MDILGLNKGEHKRITFFGGIQKCIYCGRSPSEEDDHVAAHLEPEFMVGGLACEECADLLRLMEAMGRKTTASTLEGRFRLMDAFIVKVAQAAPAGRYNITPEDLFRRQTWGKSDEFNDFMAQTEGLGTWENWFPNNMVGTIAAFLGFRG